MATPTSVASLDVQRNAQKKTAAERWFFTTLSLAMLGVATAGFSPSLVNTAGRRAPLSALAMAHGAIFLAWLGIFLMQSRLVASGNVAIHRRLGVAAVFVLPLMIALGYQTSIAMVRRGYDLSGDLRIDHDPLLQSIFPLGDLLMFSVLVACAIGFRRRPEIHKRLMLFGNIALMGAPLAHWIGHSPRLAALPPAIILLPISMFLIAAVARDYLASSRIHPLTLTLAMGMFFSGPLRAFVIGPTTAWHQLVGWLAR